MVHSEPFILTGVIALALSSAAHAALVDLGTAKRFTVYGCGAVTMTTLSSGIGVLELTRANAPVLRFFAAMAQRPGALFAIAVSRASSAVSRRSANGATALGATAVVSAVTLVSELVEGRSQSHAASMTTRPTANASMRFMLPVSRKCAARSNGARGRSPAPAARYAILRGPTFARVPATRARSVGILPDQEP